MDVTFKFTAGLLNVEKTYHLELEDNERVDIDDWIFKKAEVLELRGAQPAVIKSKTPLHSPTAKEHGATGKHPDDLTPAFDQHGRPRDCPQCGYPLYERMVKIQKGRQAGQVKKLTAHGSAMRDNCPFREWED
jgi:hypothetical protein